MVKPVVFCIGEIHHTITTSPFISDLEMESDSLTSLRAIGMCTDKYEDLNWSEVLNSDLLKSILIKLRARPAHTTFKWIRGHENNYGNIRADALANAGRESNAQMREDDEEWVEITRPFKAEQDCRL